MLRVRRLMAAALLVAAGLALSGTASAGPLLSWFGHDDPPSYSPVRYWAPGAARANDHFHSPRLSVYAPNRHPEIEPDYDILKFPHAAVDPAATLIEPPTPPATSRFRY